MKFSITHRTHYRYASPASEAYGELRLAPQDSDAQVIRNRRIALVPDVQLSSYNDPFGNEVAFFSLPFRHESLTIVNRVSVETRPLALPEASMDLTVGEARQILRADLVNTFDYLQPTRAVPRDPDSIRWAARHLGSGCPVGEGLIGLNRAIHRHFAYEAGVTDHFTPLRRVWRERRGVCQDFAHVLLGIVRAAGLPARYVCGYVEAAPPADAPGDAPMVGAVATHAWVEALVPGMFWIPLDPTNDTLCGQQHVAISYGRDAHDAAPFRGMFKGSGGQQLSVQVHVKRLRR